MKFKCKLKVIFAEEEIKQSDFAKRIKLSQSALSAIVTNQTLPSLKTAYVIAKELNRNIEDIWVLIDEENKKSS